jgi:hypothetical protein
MELSGDGLILMRGPAEDLFRRILNWPEGGCGRGSARQRLCGGYRRMTVAAADLVILGR